MSGHSNRTISFQVLAWICLTSVAGPAAWAGTLYTVTSTLDDGSNGTLRWAINQANANGGEDSIDATEVTGTITLTSSLPAITEDVIIDGPGAPNLTISGNDLYRVFFVTNNAQVSINGFTIAHGRATGGNGGNASAAVWGSGGGGGGAGMGGGIFVNSGAASIQYCTFDTCAAIGGNGGMPNDADFSGDAGGGGGGIGGNGQDGHASGGDGGGGGVLGGAAGAGSSGATNGGDGGDGAGGGGTTLKRGGNGGFGGGGGGGGGGSGAFSTDGSGGDGGFGGGGGAIGEMASGVSDVVEGQGGTFGGNGSLWDGGGGAGLGGAVFVRTGSVDLHTCNFVSNSADGGSRGLYLGAADNGQGKGGAIFIHSGASAYGEGVTYGTGGTANSAESDASSGTDNDNIYGTLLGYPSVSSIVRAGTNPTNATSVTFTVTFDQSVTGLDTTDFALNELAGVSGGSVTNVSGSGTTYTVTVNTGSGSGTTQLVFVDNDDSVTNGAIPVGGSGINNGSYSGGEAYTIDKTAPSVSGVAVHNGTSIDVTFDEAMGTGVTTAANYTISGTGKGSLSNNPNSVANTSGNTYRLTWSSGEMVNGGNITITVATAADSVGNTVGSTNSATHTSGGIGTAPTVSSVSVHDGTSVDVTFSEAMGSGVTTASNYTISGTGKGSLATNPNSVANTSGDTYRLTWSSGEMFDGGNITITVANATDSAGNAVGSPNSGTHTSGATGVAPTVSSVVVHDGLNVDVTFSEAMGSGVTTAANYAVSGTGKGSLATNPSSVANTSGFTYRLTWASGEMVNGGNITITVSSVADSAGNTIGSPNSATDTGGAVSTPPTVSSVSVHDGLNVDVTFSKAMGSGVTTAGNYALSGTGQGTLAANPNSVASVSGNVYRLTWSSGRMFIGGDITITVTGVADAVSNPIGSPNSGTDTGGAAGNALTVSSAAVVDGTHVDVTFSESVNSSGATVASNYTASGTGQGTLAANPTTVTAQGGSTYRLAWSSGEMVNGGNLTITVSGVVDLADNPLGSPNSATATGSGIGVAPTVTSVSVTGPLTVEIIFSEAMSASPATTAANYTVSGSGIGSLSVHPASVAQSSATTFQLSWSTGEMFNGGDITITASGVTDLAGNALGSPASGTAAHAATGTAPQVVSVAVVDGLTVQVVFSEAMSAGSATTATNYTLSGSGQGTLAAHPDTATQSTADTIILHWTQGEMFTGGDITVTATQLLDVAGNALASPDAATSAGGGVGTSPSVTLSSDAPATVGGAIVVALTVDEPAQSVLIAGLTLTNATASNLQTVDAQHFTVTLTPVAGGTFSVQASAGTAIDLAGNPSGSSNTISRVADLTAPSVVSITPQHATITSGDDISFEVLFSEAVTGFDAAADVAIQETGVAHTGVAITASSATSYTVKLTGTSGSGTVTLSVPAGSAADVAGNANVASVISAAVVVEPHASAPQLTVEITTESTNVAVGQDVSFGVNVSNTGDADATEVTIQIPLPDGVDFVSAELATQEPASAAVPIQASVSDGILTLTVGAVPSGQRLVIALVLRPSTAGAITLNAQVASAEAPTPVTAQADVQVNVEDQDTASGGIWTCPMCGAIGLIPLMMGFVGLMCLSSRTRRRWSRP